MISNLPLYANSSWAVKLWRNRKGKRREAYWKTKISYSSATNVVVVALKEGFLFCFRVEGGAGFTGITPEFVGNCRPLLNTRPLSIQLNDWRMCFLNKSGSENETPSFFFSFISYAISLKKKWWRFLLLSYCWIRKIILCHLTGNEITRTLKGR